MAKPWIYKDRELEDHDVPGDAIGFVYHIEDNSTKKFYIGKKQLLSKRKKRLSKKNQEEQYMITGDRRRIKKVSIITSQSNWKEYWSSSKELLKDIQELGEERFTRTILLFATSKNQLSYLELKNQFLYNVLEEDTYNGNISGKYFRGIC